MPGDREQLKKEIAWLEKEIGDNPFHPTNMYMEKEISQLERELQELEINL